MTEKRKKEIAEKVHSERIRCLHTHKNISLLYCRDCRKHDIKRAINLAEQGFAKDISKKDYHIEKLRNRISRLELADENYGKEIEENIYALSECHKEMREQSEKISRLDAELEDVMRAHNDIVKHNNEMLHERKRIRKELDKLVESLKGAV